MPNNVFVDSQARFDENGSCIADDARDESFCEVSPSIHILLHILNHIFLTVKRQLF